jgi:WD40 repeat protein
VIFLWKLDTERKAGAVSAEGALEPEQALDKEVWTAVGMLRGHEDVYDLAWSPDGLGLLSGSTDCNTIVWDVRGKGTAAEDVDVWKASDTDDGDGDGDVVDSQTASGDQGSSPLRSGHANDSFLLRTIYRH